MRHVNSYKALTYDDGKPPLAQLPPEGIRAVARVQAYGNSKYGSYHDWRKGMEASRVVSCAMRHLMAYMDGETTDPESGQPHLAHAACRILFLIQNTKDQTVTDDRFVRKPKNKCKR